MNAKTHAVVLMVCIAVTFAGTIKDLQAQQTESDYYYVDNRKITYKHDVWWL